MTVGLFGTCGNSRWRDKFITFLIDGDIEYFNPIKENWKMTDAKIEAEHLANDSIILFPVTNETLGLGSLGEVGFSILQAIKMNTDRNIIVMVDDFVSDEVYVDFDDTLIVESVKMRALVKAHLKKLNYPNVHVVSNLDEMFEVLQLIIEVEKRMILVNEVKNKIKYITNKND